MMAPTYLTRTAACLLLALAATSCSRKEEGPVPAAAPAADAAVEASSNMAEARKSLTQARGAPAPSAKPATPEAAVTSATTAQQMGSSASTYEDGERKFIRTANATFQVKDVYVAALGIEDTVASHGGFVVKNSIGTEKLSSAQQPMGGHKLMELSEYAVKGHLIVRVPSAKTQEFLRAIVGHVVFLDQRNFDARDAQFDLLRQQLDMIRNQETQREIGDAVADGGRLGTKTDAIAIRSDVKGARDAAILARKQFEDQVAFSTIELRLHQGAKVLQTEKVDVESMFRDFRPGFFPRMGEQLRDGWSGLLEVILILVGIWPVLLGFGAMAYAIVFARRRARRRDAAG